MPPQASCPRQYDPHNPLHHPNLRNWTLYTDGSGHADGMGGCAVCGWRGDGRDCFELIQARSGTTTARMEFEALLMGLQYVTEQTSEPQTVWWLSDRQDLVMSVARIWERGNNQDQWCRLGRYERQLEIHPYYAPRATTEGNRWCDRQAGACRMMMKKHFQPKQAEQTKEQDELTL